MSLIKFLKGIGQRLLITNDELASISQEKTNKNTIQDKLTLNLQNFTEMIFNDFFLIEPYTDEQYRNLFQDITDILKENPLLTSAQFAHLKRFGDFSRAMHKNLRKYIKDKLGDLVEDQSSSEPFEDSLA